MTEILKVMETSCQTPKAKNQTQKFFLRTRRDENSKIMMQFQRNLKKATIPVYNKNLSTLPSSFLSCLIEFTLSLNVEVTECSANCVTDN